MRTPKLEIAEAVISGLCQRWQIRELALFGSALRDDFGPESDVDVLVTFEAAAPWSIIDLERLRKELEALFGREVDLVERPLIEKHDNPWLKHAILSEARTVYRAA